MSDFMSNIAIEIQNIGKTLLLVKKRIIPLENRWVVYLNLQAK